MTAQTEDQCAAPARTDRRTQRGPALDAAACRHSDQLSWYGDMRGKGTRLQWGIPALVPEASVIDRRHGHEKVVARPPLTDGATEDFSVSCEHITRAHTHAHAPPQLALIVGAQ